MRRRKVSATTFDGTRAKKTFLIRNHVNFRDKSLETLNCCSRKFRIRLPKPYLWGKLCSSSLNVVLFATQTSLSHLWARKVAARVQKAARPDLAFLDLRFEWQQKHKLVLRSSDREIFIKFCFPSPFDSNPLVFGSSRTRKANFPWQRKRVMRSRVLRSLFALSRTREL